MRALFRFATAPVRRFHDWLFGLGTPETLGLLRIVYGTLALVMLLLQARFVLDLYAESGILPRAELLAWQNRILVIDVLDGAGPAAISVFFSLTVIAAFCFTLGLHTRVAGVALAIGLLNLHNRNPLILNSGDLLLRLMIFYLVLSPAGAAYSLDRHRALARGRADPLREPISLWPQRLMQCQIALLYFAATWHKLYGPRWKDGTAAFFPGQLTELARFPVPAWADSVVMVQFETYGTLAVEFLLCSLVFYRPWRNAILLLGVGLHLSIDWRLNIPLFSWITMAAYASFLEPDETARLIARADAARARVGERWLGLRRRDEGRRDPAIAGWQRPLPPGIETPHSAASDPALLGLPECPRRVA